MSLADYVEGVAEGRRGVLVQRQKDRSVWRVEEGGRVWFAKRGVTSKRRREIRREAENARALEVAGFGAPVLATGEFDGGQWLVTADAGRSPRALATSPPGGPPAPELLRDIAALVGSLHDRGWTFPELTEEHIRLDARGRLVLIDSARASHGSRPVSAAEGAVDLAALLFSLRLLLPVPSRTARARIVRDATRLRDDAVRGAFRCIDVELTRLAGRTRWRHGALTAGIDFLDALAEGRGSERGGIPFDEFLRSARHVVVRTLPDRENRTLGCGPDGRPLFFVKVFPPTKKGWSPAMREVAAIDLFQRAGILVNRLAAYAEDVDLGSMVAVKAALGEPLDDLLRRGVSVAERRALAVQTARIWRRMRECGLRHRDAYPCHLFVAPWSGQPLRFELRLIDLTRAGKAPFPRERWFVKDAAALWHGLPKPPVTRTDAVRWLREYFRVPRLDATAKRFARRVAAKERRIAARQSRKRAR
jgi:tRNA A-37 threonylcarbamoyl transferase component Bud32